MSWPPTRERLLIRHFLWRLLEHDLVSPNADRHSALSALGGSMVALSLFVSVLIAAQYQFSNFLPPGMVSLFWLDDRFLFVSASMLIAALAATAEWSALVLEPRDAMILGVLPVPKSLIVRAKFAATGLFALAVIVTWNVAPVVTRVATVPIGLRLGWSDIGIITAAQATSTCAAGAFGFLSVLFLREMVCAMLGQARFARVSAALQAALMVLLTTALLLLPSTSAGFHQRWLANESLMEAVLPPLWFVGLNESMAGAVVDSLPHTEPRERMLIVPERAATHFYRQLLPVFERQARTSLFALLLVAVGAVTAALWNARRVSIAGERFVRHRSLQAALNTVAPLVARSNLPVAGFFFSLQSLSRRATHRMALATALAIGLAFVAVATTGQAGAGAATAPSPTSGFLAAQYLLLGCALVGFRHATRLPADLKAGLTFSIAWQGKADGYIAGVRRSGWVIAVPLFAAGLCFHAVLIDWRFALAHTALGVAYAYACLQIVFLRNHQLPYVSPYVPGDDSKIRFIAYGGALVTSAVAVAAVEQRGLANPAIYLALFGALLLAGRAGRLFSCMLPVAAVTVDLDEAAPLPTQRLNLA
jgi:hypothetical protein